MARVAVVKSWMRASEIFELEKKVYAGVFSRLPVVIERGEGVYLYDVEGRRYLDMFAGIGACVLGHSHPVMRHAIGEQASQLVHVSNWCYTLPQLELAKKLLELAGMERAFFTNSGTEAVETALKLVRKATGKRKVIAATNAFHGRTLGALSLTWEGKYKKPFEPLVPEVEFARFGSLEELESKLKRSREVAAVFLEPIQGEAGVRLPPTGYLEGVRELTEEHEVLLVLDEVQTGIGRTGHLFAFQNFRIKPDVVCLGKGLAGGLPIGTTLYRCGDFGEGEHGSTFGGNPFVCSVALAVLDYVLSENLPLKAAELGRVLLNSLEELSSCEGLGLMIGIDTINGKKAALSLVERGILTIYSRDRLRLLPPLIIERGHVEEFLTEIERVKYLFAVRP